MPSSCTTTTTLRLIAFLVRLDFLEVVHYYIISTAHYRVFLGRLTLLGIIIIPLTYAYFVAHDVFLITKLVSIRQGIVRPENKTARPLPFHFSKFHSAVAWTKSMAFTGM